MRLRCCCPAGPRRAQRLTGKRPCSPQRRWHAPARAPRPLCYRPGEAGPTQHQHQHHRRGFKTIRRSRIRTISRRCNRSSRTQWHAWMRDPSRWRTSAAAAATVSTRGDGRTPVSHHRLRTIIPHPSRCWARALSRSLVCCSGCGAAGGRGARTRGRDTRGGRGRCVGPGGPRACQCGVRELKAPESITVVAIDIHFSNWPQPGQCPCSCPCPWPWPSSAPSRWCCQASTICSAISATPTSFLTWANTVGPSPRMA